MQPEFETLYSLLNLSPGCTLEEFHRAYRRAIAELHPDRRVSERPSLEQQSQLRDLIALHALATQFHRRHGRLPGASVAGYTPAAAAARFSPAARDPSPDAAQGRYRMLHWLAILPVLAFLSWRLGNRPAVDVQGETPAADSAYQTSSDAGVPEAGYVSVGMDWQTVLEIQGEPSHRGPTLWQYGASWIRFQDQRVVDWYSSPFQRLKTPTEKPQSQ